MSDSYIYCWIRKDLPVAQQIIQMSHCTWEMGASENCPNSPNFVLFEVADENALKLLTFGLDEWGIKHNTFRESLYEGQITSICTEIIEDKEKRKLFRGFKLYK